MVLYSLTYTCMTDDTTVVPATTPEETPAVEPVAETTPIETPSEPAV